MAHILGLMKASIGAKTLGFLGGAGLAMGVNSLALSPSAEASGDVLHWQHYPWYQSGLLHAFDTNALRRGFEVYRQVCSTCHSIRYLNYRNLVGNSHTEEQAKALAASVSIKDGPDDQGEMFERPGKLSDPLPKPYPNDEYARFVNGGALPPDLSLIVKARPGDCDYIFSLLTGYKDAPHGFALRGGLYYNPYFQGGAISMPPPLLDGQVEYEDGTEANVSQMAKDVTVFLNWVAEPEHDERKLMAAKVISGLMIATFFGAYYKRFLFSIYKSRRVSWIDHPAQKIRRD